MNDDAAIDTSRLDDLRDLFQEDFTNALASFLENAQAYTTAIGGALAKGDCQEAERNAHKLKSSAAMFGAVFVSAVTVDIETEAHRDDIAKAQVLYERLVPEMAKINVLIAAYCRDTEVP